VSLSRFINGGRTTLPRVIALDWLEKDDRDPSFFQLSDGTVLLTPSDCISRSTDNAKHGANWSPRPYPLRMARRRRMGP